MSARALARAGLQPVPQIDLPVGHRPQYVNDRGIEVEHDPALMNGHERLGVDGHHDGGIVEDDTIEVAQEDEGLLSEEVLLSLAESLVVPFSLHQTRQRHLTNLLPHIFSHPPIPSYNRPRPRPLPKGKLLFPTPTPTIPLPSREYHAPDKPSSMASSPAPTPEGQTPVEPASTTKAKGKSKERDDVPAHEIDCIARCTLTIGPISYPGTELWIGRFVEPQYELLRTYKKREKPANTHIGNRQPTDKPRPIFPTMPGGAGLPGAIPGTYKFRPNYTRPPGPVPAPRPPTGPAPRPPPGGAAARPPIEPGLIQRVNQAATLHPWLSVIIHKAARNSATKEELAKLGRIVARLGKGEGIGEGPLDGLPQSGQSQPSDSSSSSTRPGPSRPPATYQHHSPASASNVRPPSSAPRRPIIDSDSDLSDEDVDMTGPPQQGGGPIDPELLPQTARSPSLPNTTVGDKAKNNPPPKPAPSNIPIRPAQPIPPLASASTTNGYQPPVNPVATTNGAANPSTISTPANNIASGHIPPPKRIYPIPPPFLLVAFKEMPTEKYLLPLGSRSFISRVTDPVPPSSGAPTQSEEPVPSVEVVVDTPVVGKGRTRKSMGRGAKPDKGGAESAVKESSPDPVPADNTPAFHPFPMRSDLPVLPGMDPSSGTVLLSTIVPVAGWSKPKWDGLEKRLPFYSRDYDEKPILPSELGDSQTKSADASITPSKPPSSKKKENISPAINRHGQMEVEETHLDSKTLLNLSTEDFMPEEGSVQAVTIRLEGISDHVWLQMKRVIEHVERVEMKALGKALPEVLEQLPPPLPAPIPQWVERFDPTLHPRLRTAYADFRKHRFERLLRRVPQRTFPKYRLPHVRGDLKDATTDKWHPRPYPMSTRPLYLTSPPPEGAEMDYEQYEEAQPKRKRGQAEEEVMFEMPVSLEMLDERVEAGAKKSVARRVGKLKLDKKVSNPNSKRWGKRYIPGTTCEGCGRSDVRVWRRGPGGNGTLCNPCGDKFTTNTLGELKAPGAASAGRTAEQTGEGNGKEPEDGQISALKAENGEDEGARAKDAEPNAQGPASSTGVGEVIQASESGLPLTGETPLPEPVPASVPSEQAQSSTTTSAPPITDSVLPADEPMQESIQAAPADL